MADTVAVIPCYNHPDTIGLMVDAVRAHGLDVVVVDDGSHADCAAVLDALAVAHGPALTLVRKARELGFSHALQIDADGQHDVKDIPAFLALSRKHPDAVVCGQPVYDDSVPKGRLYGRYATHIWVWINTLSLDIRDSMCGFRVYPLGPVVDLIDGVRLGRRMDFDPELLVRLHWRRVPLVSVPTRVSYPLDGISHFKLLKDNVLISGMHARLFAGMLVRLPLLLWRKVA